MSTHISQQSYVSLCTSLKSSLAACVVVKASAWKLTGLRQNVLFWGREWVVSVSLLDIDGSGFYPMAGDRVFTVLLAFSVFLL